MNTKSIEKGWGIARCAVSHPGFFVAVALLFAVSAAVTIAWCMCMSDMGAMPMAGGWTLSMMWMPGPVCGPTWLGSGAAFLGMWTAMMLAMMLPPLLPMLWRYREAASRSGATKLGRLTALMGAGYFCVWTLCGPVVFVLGVALTTTEMREPILARAAPIAIGVAVLMAGALQFTAWKSRHLACCRAALPCGRSVPTHEAAAWRHGLRLGLHCGFCCGNLMAVLLLLGVMDLRAMAAVTGAITAERILPAGTEVARAIGAVVVVLGLLLIAQAVARA